jgi:parallel beta-helix repeat protein
MTFSEGNVFARNRLVENAICGIWGGFSSDSLIAGNRFEGNGGMAYGLERGGINMEHASGNRILGNIFRNNKCAIHLWWDNDAALLRSPGVAATDRGVSANVIARNVFELDKQLPNLRPTITHRAATPRRRHQPVRDLYLDKSPPPAEQRRQFA